MGANNLITAATFSAFLECPTKGYLLGIGETAPDTFFGDTETRIYSKYKEEMRKKLGGEEQIADFLSISTMRHGCGHDNMPHSIDCGSAIYDFASPPERPTHRDTRKALPSGIFVPLLLVPWDKPDHADSMVLSFGALALSQVTGSLAPTGTLIYGDGQRRKTVRITDYMDCTRESITTISTSLRDQKPPRLTLNRHCAVCDFQRRCRGLAVELDDLSLLTGMTPKERAKCSSKGISTITQLSYGYRPRRRRRAKPDTVRAANRAKPVVKNDNKLKALAIKKNQIHVIGAQSLQFEGVPTFLDVEGMPDRHFYYLIGLKYECAGEQVEQSFWANRLEDEREIWESCLRTLKAIGNAQIVSYGAYEARFLKEMKARYALTPADMGFVDHLIGTSVNLLGCIYGKVYFPTFSNSLKEVGSYLGSEWAWREASGAAAPLLRRAWELGVVDGFKYDLIGYNMDDCRAAARVAQALMSLCSGNVGLNAVDVGSLEVSFQRTYGKFDSTLPDFAKINNAAYWDYQRSKVYARNDKTIRRTVENSKTKNKKLTVEREVTIGSIPEKCPKCDCAEISLRSKG